MVLRSRGCRRRLVLALSLSAVYFWIAGNVGDFQGVASAFAGSTRPSRATQGRRLAGRGATESWPKEQGGRITLVAEASLPGVSPAEAFKTVSTPARWPEIVLSSLSVNGQTANPLRRGDTVTEYFGLPPIWSPAVAWECASADEASGTLDVRAEDGVPGLASACQMKFFVSDSASQVGTTVRLEMSYQPESPLAVVAQPLLQIDNWVALNVLLPVTLRTERRPS